MDDIKKLRRRFVKDYNLPINIFANPYFDYYTKLYDFFPLKIWNDINEKIEKEYNGNVSAWLDYCAEVRDKAIDYVLNLESYKEFNNSDIKKYNIEISCPERSVYNEETDGKRFISVDIKKANFQILKKLGIITDDTYEDFIGGFGGDEYIKKSKYLRQVIFGKMNPGRVIKVEKYYAAEIYKLVKEIFKGIGFELYSINSDELVFAEGNCRVNFSARELYLIKELVKEKIGIDVRVEHIEVKRLPIVNSNGSKVDAYVRKNLFTGEEVLKKTSTIFFPQIYKLWKGQEIMEIDRNFFAEEQIATFNDSLRYDKSLYSVIV